MLKFVESSVTFTEVPQEISLCLNLSLCPNHCKGCSEAYLTSDIGVELTEEVLIDLINKNAGISCVCFMGGDNSHEDIRNLTNFVHDNYKLKVAMYSGRDCIDLDLAEVLDYYKIGRWIPFEGSEETWKNQSAGPLCLPTSNQIMYKREGNKLIDITHEFRKYPVNNWKSVII